MKTILVVDDEPRIVELARDYLEHAGFAVLPRPTARRPSPTARTRHPDLVVLDLGLPGLDGLDVTRQLRTATATAALPIVMLTARDDELDKLLGLELGADDYLTKPFSPRELVARVRAVLRRADRPVEAGDVDPRRRPDAGRAADADRGGRPDRRPHPDRVHAPRHPRPPAGPHLHPLAAARRAPRASRSSSYERAIDSHIKNLRRKLEPDPRRPRYVLTVYGVGYRFADDRAEDRTTALPPDRRRPWRTTRRPRPPWRRGRARPATTGATTAARRGGPARGRRRAGMRRAVRRGFGCLFGARLPRRRVGSWSSPRSLLLASLGPLPAVIVAILVVVGDPRHGRRAARRGAARSLDRHRRGDRAGSRTATTRVRVGARRVGHAAGPRARPRLRHDGRAARADEEQRRTLLDDVSHELRTPLTVITGNLEAMLDGVHPADEAHLAPILEETRVMERLIDDLRTRRAVRGRDARPPPRADRSGRARSTRSCASFAAAAGAAAR